MAIAFIDSTATYDGAGESSTPSMDSSGANLLVAMWLEIIGFAGTPTDSKSNTWTTTTPVNIGGTYYLQCAYVQGSPTVGSSHTFSVPGALVTILGVIAFSGAAASGSFDQFVGANAGASSTVQPGSLTPAQDNEVLISYAMGFGDAGSNTFSINSSFTECDDVVAGNDGMELAYKIQTTAGAENPTITASTWTAATMMASMAAFKSAAAAGLAVLPFRTTEAIRRAANW